MKRRREEREVCQITKVPRTSETPPRDVDRDEARDEVPASPEHGQPPAPSPRPSQAAVILLLGRMIPSGQLSHLKAVARRKDFNLSASLDDSVTHVVSALPTYERTEAALKR